MKGNKEGFLKVLDRKYFRKKNMNKHLKA